MKLQLLPITLVFVFALSLGHGVLNHAHAKKLILPDEIDFAKGTEVREAVRKECKLQTKIPEFVKKYSEDNFSGFAKEGKASSENWVLDMEIIDVEGRGGGAWSGHKQVTVKFTLKADGKTYTGKARRYSGGGAFGGYKGTCSILGRCAKAVGKDIAVWLAEPSNDARLGNY